MPIVCSDFEKSGKFTLIEFFVLALKNTISLFSTSILSFLFNSKSERLKLHPNSFNFFRALSGSKVNSFSSGFWFIFGNFLIE
ncbi:unnamed protein product [Blepharisma stoltei]|uniref:Uncharacterized protein n=1 Tax=Blepharisma stoltei TaxID=1481888 RepID=A0AAU9JQT1_9CILI|nr:unnamed protein product [Blepharisma stoltei]